MTLIHRLAVVAAIVAAIAAPTASCQTVEKDGVQVRVTPTSIPCEPGTLIFGMFKCAPAEEQGILVHVRSDPPWDFDEYVVEVRYTDSKGSHSIIKTVPAKYPITTDAPMFDTGWRTVGFNTGRVHTDSLPGITITSIRVTKAPAPVIISVGDTRFSGPP